MKSLLFSFKQVKALAWIWMIIILSIVAGSILQQLLGGLFFYSFLNDLGAIQQTFIWNDASSEIWTTFDEIEETIKTQLEKITLAKWIFYGFLLLIFVLGTSLLNSFFEAMKIGASKQSVEGEEITFPILLSYGKKHFFTFFFASIFYKLIFIIFALIVGVLFAFGNVLGACIAMFSLLVAVIISLFAYQAMVYEEVGLFKGFFCALKMSFKGTFDGLLGAIGLACLTFLLYLPIMIAYFIESYAFTIFAVILTIVVTFLLVVILVPVMYIWMMKIYKETRN